MVSCTLMVRDKNLFFYLMYKSLNHSHSVIIITSLCKTPFCFHMSWTLHGSVTYFSSFTIDKCSNVYMYSLYIVMWIHVHNFHKQYVMGYSFFLTLILRYFLSPSLSPCVYIFCAINHYTVCLGMHPRFNSFSWVP
jgi:hypothetical protein